MAWRLFAGLMLLLILELPSPATQSPGKSLPPNVILITIDTLRADYLRCYGNESIETPALDSLAADGTLFERAYCQVPMTPPSHASILTGTYPPTHGVRDFTSGGLARGFPTIATILKQNGYSTAAFVSAYVLDSVWGFNQGFDVYYDRFDPREFLGTNPGNVQRKAGETIDLTLRWLKDEAKRPYFLWIHLFDPHHDYAAPEPFRSRYSRDPYAGEVAYTDQEIGRLLSALKSRGDYETSLIVATSDHGEAFGEHGEEEHGFFLYNPTLQVPLLIKLPNGAGKPVHRHGGVVETVDIAPTVLQVTRVRADGKVGMQGTGLLSTMLRKSSAAQRASYAETLYPLTTFGWSDLASYTRGRFKYIDAPRPELYDLDRDPGEKNNLAGANRAMANQMKQQLDQLRQRIQTSSPSTSAPLDPQRMEALRALGYVAVSVPTKTVAGSTGLPDPKDRVQIFNKMLTALQAAEAGVLEKSNRLLGEILAEEPKLFIAHYSLGLNHLRMREAEKALGSFERARSLNASFDLIDINRAAALGQLGRHDEAISLLETLLTKDPGRLPARRQLAQLYSQRGDFSRAVQAYRKILEARPDDVQIIKLLGIAEAEAQDYLESASTLKRALDLGVDDAVTYNFLGIALANSNKDVEAISAYRRALQIKADYHQARLNLSFALLKAGDPAEAKRQFSRLCSESPRFCEPYRKYFP